MIAVSTSENCHSVDGLLLGPWMVLPMPDMPLIVMSGSPRPPAASCGRT